MRLMFFRQLFSALCLLFLITSASKASDISVASDSHDSRPVNGPSVSNLNPEELMQAVRRDLDLAVQNHEALSDSLRSKNPESIFPISDLHPTLFPPSRAGAQAGWETLSSTSNAQVQAWESYFSGSGSARLRSSVLRLGPYREHLEGVLRQWGLPPELIAIAFVESEFVPRAVSPKGATGPWQFMPATAARYGLLRNGREDERTDLERSTLAAARYLADLHSLFMDWPLALAAYNAGEDRIKEAIAKGKTRDFWTLSQLALLPDETRAYVPKVLGAASAWRALGKSTQEITPFERSNVSPNQRRDWVVTLTSPI